jgi:RNA polymerase sigma-70 factor (ECF subfamily)
VDSWLDFAEIGSVGASESAGEVSFRDRIARGELDALRDAYRRHHAAVRAFAGRLLGDHAAAEDLVHDVFVALPRAAARFRGDCSFEGFLVGIAANLARRHLRTSKRRRAAFQRLSWELPAAPPPPDQTAAEQELVLLLMRALDELPDKLRISFVLVQIEERDASEVAALLGVPASTVRARVAAARSRLQAQRHFAARKELR